MASSIGTRMFWLVIVVLAVWFMLHQHNKTDYSKPWWTGTATQRVCKVPYYDNSECYTLAVTSDGTNITRIDFPKGGYFTKIEATNCHEAADKAIERFCEFYESGNRWDVLPL